MWDQRVDLQGAELAGEVDVLRRRDILIAEENHLVLDQGVVDLLEQLIAELSTPEISAPSVPASGVTSIRS